MGEADALGLDEVDDDLELAACLVHRQAAVEDDLRALGQVVDDASLPYLRRPEEDAAQLSAAVLDREVGVAGGLRARTGDLARYPDVAEDEVALEELAEVSNGLGDGKDLHAPAQRQYTTSQPGGFFEEMG